MTEAEVMGDDVVNMKDDFDGGATKGHDPAQVGANLAMAAKNNLQKILPLIMGFEKNVEKFVRTVMPIINQALAVYEETRDVLEPYGLFEIGECLTGFAMMFFGGFFITTVAVWEAINQAGYEEFKMNLKLLYNEYSSFRDANAEDDVEDLDGDGIADVNQIRAEQYAIRKMLLALKATDPEKINKSFQNLYLMFVAVVASLRLQFARVLSLGTSLGDQAFAVFKKTVQPQIELFVDEDYHKWLPVVGNYVCRFLGVTFAFRIQRYISTVQTGVKGARVFTKGLTDLAERNGHGYLTDGYADEALSAVLAVLGIYLQLFAWDSLPIVIQLAFFPAFFLESFLQMFVGFAMIATGE